MKKLFLLMAILTILVGTITEAATAATSDVATATTNVTTGNNAATPNNAATTAPPPFKREKNTANGEMKRKPASPGNSSTVTTVEATFLGLTKDQWLLTGIFIIVCVIGFFSQKANADAFLRNKTSDSN